MAGVLALWQLLAVVEHLSPACQQLDLAGQLGIGREERGEVQAALRLLYDFTGVPGWLGPL